MEWGQTCHAPAYYARAPGVGRLVERGGGVRGFVGLFTLTLTLSHRGRGDVALGRFPPARE